MACPESSPVPPYFAGNTHAMLYHGVSLGGYKSVRTPDQEGKVRIGQMNRFPASSFLKVLAPVFWFTENLVVACIPLALSLFSRVVRAFMITVSMRD